MSAPNRSAHPAATPLLMRWGSRGTALVLGLAALVLVLIGATIGLALAGGGPVPVSISDEGKDPVDTGFARDMVVHHQQGVDMAHIAELNSDDKTIRSRAYDIQYTQASEIGTMTGWLDLWGVPRLTSDPHMGWMGTAGMAGMSTGAACGSAAALMPGMATPQEMAKLQSLRGQASDVYFLQLMIRHHQGGTAMMTYASNHAVSPVVRNFAGKMVDAQTSEIGVMTDMLDKRG
ncbi:MAG: DUF305 domain-containing protein, partial [Nakamurella sp.]